MRIETNIVCIEIDVTSTFPPFEEMYTWLGRIRDRQLPAQMVINEEGYVVVLLADRVTEDSIEFSIRGTGRNKDTIYLKTVVDNDVLITSFHHEIVSSIAKQFDEPEPSFIANYENLNWDSLLRKPERPHDWQKRLAIYGGGEGRYKETNLDNFSLTLEEEYLVNLQNGLNQIRRLRFSKNKKELEKLVSFYRELAIDLALDAIDPDWYQQQREKLNTKYKIDDCPRWKNRIERIEEYEKQRNLKQTRLKALQIGQIVDGTIIGLRPYGVLWTLEELIPSYTFLTFLDRQ